MATYNKYYESWFRGTNTIPATYGNVSIYTTGKTDLKGGLTTTNLAINKNNTANALDVSGNVVIDGSLNVGGNTFVNGGLEAIGDYFVAIPTANNPKGYGISVDNRGFLASGSDLQYLLFSLDATDFNNKFRISSQSSLGIRDYLLVEPKNKSNNTNELKATIDGDMTITNGNLTIGTGGGAVGFTKSMVGLSNVDNTSDANKPISTATQTALNLRALDTAVVHLTGTEQINAQKTFYLNYSASSITNPYLRDFSNNGFAVPPSHSSFTTMISQTASYNITYSGWNFVSAGAIGLNRNEVFWWYGSGSVLEWTQTYCRGAPPNFSNPTNPIQSSTFTGNYAIRFETFAPTQSFYVQNNFSISAGIYIATFYSYWGSSNYGGGGIGATTASISVSFNGGVSQTYKYADPETRSQQRWKQHNIFFVVPAGQTATYIRWTPNELQSATQRFRWALAGLSIRKYNGQQFQDDTAISTIAGSLSYLQNPYLVNPIALNSLTCAGIPSFNATTGASNLILNTAFNTSENNISNIAMGYGLTTGNNYQNNVIIGFQSGGGGLIMSRSTAIGAINSAYNDDVAIGCYLRTNKVALFSGSNVVLGSFIGIQNNEYKFPTTGVSRRCVAIGSEIFGAFNNGGGNNPYSPDEAVAIGYRSQFNCWDNYNTSVGCYSLQSLDGTNNVDVGFGYTRITQYNCGYGYKAGLTPRNATNCVFVGSFADVSGNSTETTLFTNSTALGYGAKVRGDYSTAIGSDVFCDISNCVMIGRSNDSVKINGSFNVAGNTTFTSLPTCNAVVDTSNQLVNKTYVDSAIAGSVPSGVAFLDVSNNFTQQNTFSGITRFYGDASFNNPVHLYGGLYAGHTQTINFGTNAPTMNGTNIHAETIPDGALTTNIPKKNGNSHFTGHNTHSGITTFNADGSFNLLCDISANGVLISPTELSYLNNVSSNIQNQLDGKQPTGAYALDASCVHIENAETISGAKTLSATTTFTGGITASATQTITFGTNNPTMGIPLVSGVRVSGTGAYNLTGGVVFPQTNGYRKLLLYPNPLIGGTQNDFQNYSIGANNINLEMVFLVPDNTRNFKFSYGTSTTTKTDMLTIASTGLTLSAGTLTLPSASISDTALSTNVATKNSTNTFSALNTFSAGLTLSSGTLTLPSASISDTALSSNVMLENAENIMTGSITLRQGTQDNVNIEPVGGIRLYNGTNFYLYTGTTTASPVFFSLDYTNSGMDFYGTATNFYNTQLQIRNTAGVIHGKWNTTALDLSGCLLRVEQMNVAHSNTTSITGATTISKPFNQYYAVEATGTAFTITLPTITAKELGKELVFRKVRQINTLVSISFIGNGTQKVYNTALTGVATANALMTSTTYIVRLVALLDSTTGGGAYGWFQL